MRTAEQKERRAAYMRQYRQENNEFMKQKDKDRYAKRKPEQQEYKRWHHIWTTFRLTKSDYEALWAMQGSVCQVCKEDTDKKHVDHCHTTGDVRGILCASCNLFIGQLEKSPSRIDSALQYLGESK